MGLTNLLTCRWGKGPLLRMMMMGRMMMLLQAGQGNGESREAVKQRVLGVSRFSEIMFIITVDIVITVDNHQP